MNCRSCVALFAVLSSLVGFQVASAQEEGAHRTWGLSASLQGSQLEFMTPFWLARSVTLAPTIGFVWAQDAGTDLRLGMLTHVYLGEGKLVPFVGARFGALISSPSGGESMTDWLVGLAGGGEYSFDQHFAVGAELQLNMTISADRSTRFGNPGKKTLNTASALYAAFYF